MSDHIVHLYLEHGFHISNMKPIFVKVQKHCVNESFLVTIPNVIAQAISLTKGDIMKTVLDNNKRVIMEKV
jgi:antitoxin component of MazEF toxin-antitoxin module